MNKTNSKSDRTFGRGQVRIVFLPGGRIRIVKAGRRVSTRAISVTLRQLRALQAAIIEAMIWSGGVHGRR